MACGNPEVKHLCPLGLESGKRLCKKCKWSMSPEEAKAARKTAAYNSRMQARTK